MPSLWLLIGVPVVTVVLLTLAVVWYFPHAVRHIITHVLNAPLSDTLAELYVSSKSTTPIQLLYLSMRAAHGDVVIRPMGSAKPAKGFDDLTFVPAQLARRPVAAKEPVSMETVLGHRARRPLQLSMPLYVSGMAYGLAITRNARLALAKGCNRAGVALNSGQGPVFDEELDAAGRYILQFGRWNWNREPDLIRRVDMIEAQVGQGAMPGNGVVATPEGIGPEIHRLMNLPADQPPDILAHLFLDDPGKPATLQEVVRYLRSVNPDIPVAIKMGGGDDVEGDIDVALDAGVDVIVIDGTEGATGNAPITLSDHFGLPSLVVLSRAVRHLNRRGAREQVDLVISGGLREPGDFLKAYALGADCVAIGTSALFAIAHKQIASVFPFYPPTDLVFYRSRKQISLDVERGAQGLYNFLASCKQEMAVAIRTLGKRSFKELTPEDLVTLDREIADTTGVRYAWLPPEKTPEPGGRLPDMQSKFDPEEARLLAAEEAQTAPGNGRRSGTPSQPSKNGVPLKTR